MGGPLMADDSILGRYARVVIQQGTEPLRDGSFRARLGLLTIDGSLVASAEGALIRISEEIPFEGACPECQGGKMCEDCGGTGGGPNAVCAYCRGTGQCTRCGGSGSVTESQ